LSFDPTPPDSVIETEPIVELEKEKGGYLKIIFDWFIWIKAAVLIFLNAQGIWWHKKDARKNYFIIILLVMGIIIIGWHGFLRLWGRRIMPIFVCQCVA
jgi:hypothetical protein